MLPKRASLGEIYAAQLPDGRFAACQVVAEQEKHVELVGLHWIGDELPTLAQLENVPALEVYHHTHKPHVDRVKVDHAPPYWVTRLGAREPIVKADAPSKAFSSWRAPFDDVLRQWRWDNEVPAEEKAAYVRAMRGDEITLKLAGIEHRLDSTTWRLWIGPRNEATEKAPPFALPIDPGVPCDWSELLKLGALAEIVYSGRDPGFAEYLRSRKRIRRVVWRNHEQEAIDLRGSGVRIFGVDAGDRSLALEVDALTDLTLYGPASALRLGDAQRGRGLRLHLQHHELPVAPIAGLEQLRSISARKLKKAHISRLIRYTALQSVSLAGAPGELCETDALSRLSSLRRLALRDFFRGDFDAFPPADAIGSLDTLEVYGLPEAAVLTLCERGKTLRCCSIGGGKPCSWVEERFGKEA